MCSLCAVPLVPSGVGVVWLEGGYGCGLIEGVRVGVVLGLGVWRGVGVGVAMGVGVVGRVCGRGPVCGRGRGVVWVLVWV